MAEPPDPATPGPQVPVLTLTLNPALDMATAVPKLVADEKLRCADPRFDPGGGGINVTRAIHALGGASLALVALGGLTGERLGELLRADGVTFLGISGPGETRLSLTVTEAATGRQYRFMLPGPVWGAADQARVLKLLGAVGRSGAYAVISGSQPPGVPVDFPARLAAAMGGMRVVLDTSGKALHQAVEHPIPGLEMLRMDGEEAEALAGHRLGTRAETADFAAGLVQAGVARLVIVARGADGSVLAGAGLRLHAVAPEVTVVSKVGAGDSFVGACVLALARGLPPEVALAQGVSAAAAAVMSEATELCRPADVARLVAGAVVTRV